MLINDERTIKVMMVKEGILCRRAAKVSQGYTRPMHSNVPSMPTYALQARLAANCCCVHHQAFDDETATRSPSCHMFASCIHRPNCQTACSLGIIVPSVPFAYHPAHIEPGTTSPPPSAHCRYDSTRLAIAKYALRERPMAASVANMMIPRLCRVC